MQSTNELIICAITKNIDLQGHNDLTGHLLSSDTISQAGTDMMDKFDETQGRYPQQQLQIDTSNNYSNATGLQENFLERSESCISLDINMEINQVNRNYDT